MKRPVVGVVLFYAVGLLLAEMLQPPLAILFSISFAVLALAGVFKKFRAIFLCALLIFVGWTNLVFRTAIVSPHDLRNLIGNEPRIASVRGQLVRSPQIKISERDGEETERSMAQLHVSEIQFAGKENWQSALGDIVVSTPAPLTNFFAGQSVEISGVIAPPPPPLAEGLFDSGRYFGTRGIYYELKTDSSNDWKRWGEDGGCLQGPPLTDRFLNWSKHTLALGLPEDETARLLWAMTLGWRTAFTGDVGDPFLRAGTINHFFFCEMV